MSEGNEGEGVVLVTRGELKVYVNKLVPSQPSQALDGRGGLVCVCVRPSQGARQFLPRHTPAPANISNTCLPDISLLAAGKKYVLLARATTCITTTACN